jgi:hypothetical protein
MIVNIPFRCCELLIDNSKILPLIDITPSVNTVIESFQLASTNIMLDKNYILNNDITQINVLLFCIWFINVLMFIDWSSKK